MTDGINIPLFKILPPGISIRAIVIPIIVELVARLLRHKYSTTFQLSATNCGCSGMRVVGKLMIL